MKVALIQFQATDNKNDNIRRAKESVKEAIAKKAKWVLLPEIFSFRGDLRDKEILQQVREHIPGKTTQEFLKLAQAHKADILLGSLLEEAPGAKAYNTTVALNGSSGKIRKYRKIHLFEAVLGDKILNESVCFSKGNRLGTVYVGEFKVGLSVCYDLRFPGLYQKYAQMGATALTVPSCFTKQTGRAHWESLLKARAIENLCYVFAPNQVGKDTRGIEAYGHSMVVDPWGRVVACGLSNKEEIIYADVFLQEVKEARRRLPGIIKD